MTTVVLARVIGADKVRRRPFKADAIYRSAAGPSRAPSPGATQPARAPSPQPDRPRNQAPTQPGKIVGQNSRAVKAKQDSTARVLPCVNCAWAQSVVGYSLLQGGADG